MTFRNHALGSTCMRRSHFCPHTQGKGPPRIYCLRNARPTLQVRPHRSPPHYVSTGAHSRTPRICGSCNASAAAGSRRARRLSPAELTLTIAGEPFAFAKPGESPAYERERVAGWGQCRTRNRHGNIRLKGPHANRHSRRNRRLKTRRPRRNCVKGGDDYLPCTRSGLCDVG